MKNDGISVILFLPISFSLGTTMAQITFLCVTNQMAYAIMTM